MIPFILSVVGGYLIGESMKKEKVSSEDTIAEDAKARTREILAVPKFYKSYSDGGEIAAGPDYYDQNWTNIPYQEKVEKQQKMIADAGVEVGDIVIKPEGNLTLYGTVTLLPESDPKDMKIGMMSYMSPIRIVFDDMTQKATGSKYDYIDGYKLYLKKDIAQMFGPKKKKK